MKILKTVALFEGMSLIALLFVAVPVKYLLDNALLVKMIGPIHGILFIAFIIVLILSFLRQQITLTQTLLGLIASCIPFGTFIFNAKCLKNGNG